MNNDNDSNSGKMNLEVQNFDTYEDLYKSITKEGSLGLLALGATGLGLWRKKRVEIEQAEKSSEKR